MKNYFSFWCLLILLSSCKSTDVKVIPTGYLDFNWEKFKSFDFYELNKAEIPPTVNEIKFQQRVAFIKAEIIRNMRLRGLEQATSEPDLRVNLGISIKDQTQTRETSLVTDPGTFNYIGQRRYSWKAETIEVGKYREGSLTLELIDGENNQPVWIGIQEGVLPENEEKLQTAIKNAVDKFFEKMDHSVP